MPKKRKRKRSSAAAVDRDLYASPSSSAPSTFANAKGRTARAVGWGETARSLVALLFATEMSASTGAANEPLSADNVVARSISSPDVALAMVCLAYPAVGNELTTQRGRTASTFPVGIDQAIDAIKRAIGPAIGGAAAGDAPAKITFDALPSTADARSHLRYSKAVQAKVKRELANAAKLLGEVGNTVAAGYANAQTYGAALDTAAQVVVSIYISEPIALALRAAGAPPIKEEAAAAAYKKLLLVDGATSRENDVARIATVVRSVVNLKTRARRAIRSGVLGRIAPAIASACDGLLAGFSFLAKARPFSPPSAAMLNENGCIGFEVQSLDYDVACEFDDTGRPTAYASYTHVTCAEQIRRGNMVNTPGAMATALRRHTPAGRLWLAYEHSSGSLFLATDTSPQRPLYVDAEIRPDEAALYGHDTALLMGLLV